VNTEHLVAAGYQIENAKITSADLSMEDHGCLTLYLGLKGVNWGCNYGGVRLGKGYLGATSFEGSAQGLEYIMRILDTVGVFKLSSLEGKYVRVAIKGWGEPVKIIGNIIDDKWLDPEEFFQDTKYKA